MADGELPPPPIMQLVGADRIEADEGRVAVLMPAAEFHYNPIGSVHSGVLATLLDSAAGCAVQSTLPAGSAYTSLDLSVKFLRRLTADSGTCRATGHVVHAGRRTALARAELVDGAGRLVAEATSSCLILPG